jgi:thiosulfate dehydrogenase
MKNILLCMLLLVGVSYAKDNSVDESSQINYGGQLYDKWFKVMPGAKKPTSTHKSYQGKKQGNTTWRCKECHGWDYKGVNGAYAKGSHFSGIKGVNEYAGKDIKDIKKVILNDTHGFKNIFGEKEINSLALFISKGQIDTSSFIDMKTKKVTGDKIAGAKLYNGICASCHGMNGDQINFKEAPTEIYVGDAARGNPWETLHKIRFGHPGSFMTSLFILPEQSQIDILSYIVTLK